MKHAALCALFLVAPPAAAQAPPPPTCWSVNGAAGYRMGFTAAGNWAAWWCPDAWGDWTPTGLVMRSGYALKHPPTVIADPAATAEAYWRTNVTFNCVRPGSNDPPMLALCDAARNAAMDSKPPPPFVVRPNGAYLTRPTYPLVAGVRGTVSNGSVPIRDANGRPTACNPAERLGNYMQVKRTPGTVTLCGATAP